MPSSQTTEIYWCLVFQCFYQIYLKEWNSMEITESIANMWTQHKHSFTVLNYIVIKVSPNRSFYITPVTELLYLVSGLFRNTWEVKLLFRQYFSSIKGKVLLLISYLSSILPLWKIENSRSGTMAPIMWMHSNFWWY